MRTGATPASFIPSSLAAAGERSMTRPRMKGPRSLMRTVTELPLERLVTRTRVFSGSERCAAVISVLLIFSPLAVRFDRRDLAYQEASPVWVKLASFSLSTEVIGAATTCGGAAPVSLAPGAAQAESAAAIARAAKAAQTLPRECSSITLIPPELIEFVDTLLRDKPTRRDF